MNGKQREKKIVRLLMLCALILFGAKMEYPFSCVSCA